ncbi:AraC family transcriptional regulator [Paenibacillus sp. strain BS8-2]
MIELFGAGFDDRDPNWKQPSSRLYVYSIALICSGKMISRIDGNILKVCEGDLLFVPEGCVLESYHADDDYHQKYWATFIYKPSEGQQLPMLQTSTPVVVKARQYGYMKQQFAQLIMQWIEKLPYYEHVCSGIITNILGRMNREFDTTQYIAPKAILITKIQDYVLEHYREDIRVDKLAMLVDRSPNYISSMFRRMTGQTVKEYINQVKLAAARDMLSQKHVNIRLASEYVGFCDQAYFNKVFKKVYGFPPSVLVQERELTQLER